MNYQWRGEIETHITTLLPLEGPTNDQLRQGLSSIKTSTYVIDDHNYALTFYTSWIMGPLESHLWTKI